MTVMGDGPVSNRIHESTLSEKEREGRGQREERERKLWLTKICQLTDNEW